MRVRFSTIKCYHASPSITITKELPKGGVFCTEGDDGQLTDKGLIDAMLQDDALITRQLTEAGIIRQYYVEDKKGR